MVYAEYLALVVAFDISCVERSVFVFAEGMSGLSEVQDIVDMELDGKLHCPNCCCVNLTDYKEYWMCGRCGYRWEIKEVS